VQPLNGKGCTAEVVEDCPVFRCWVGRENLPDCHNNFVKRYRWHFGFTARFWACIRFTMDRLAKRFIFYPLPDG